MINRLGTAALRATRSREQRQVFSPVLLNVGGPAVSAEITGARS